MGKILTDDGVLALERYRARVDALREAAMIADSWRDEFPVGPAIDGALRDVAASIRSLVGLIPVPPRGSL
jgi:hypothetical protein